MAHERFDSRWNIHRQRMPWSKRVGEPGAEEKEKKERRKSLSIAAEKQASLSIFRYGQRDMETIII
jgi:hypothetical protein